MFRHFFELRNQWTGEHSAEIAAQRKHFFKSLRSKADQVRFEMSLEMVRIQIERMANRNAYPFRDEISPVSTVDTATARGLLGYISDGSVATFAIRKRFEALRTFDQTRMLYDIEHHSPISTVRTDIQRIIKLFERTLFVPGGAEIFVTTTHDSARAYHVVGCTFERDRVGDASTNGLVKKHLLHCRQLTNKSFALLEHRPKVAWDTLYKIFGQKEKGNKDNPFLVSDRRGIRFVTPGVEESLDLGHRITEIIERFGGHIYDKAHAFQFRSATSRVNRYSSDNYRMLKFDFHHEHTDFEVQILTLADYYTSKYATDEVNHELYRLNQAFDFHLPITFPYEIYGLDWKRADIRERLRSIVISRLEWKHK